MKKAICVLALLLLLSPLAACAPQGPASSPGNNGLLDSLTGKKLTLKDGAFDMKIEKNPVVTITMEDGSTIKIELYPDKAPNTVCNFISLITKQFYDGVIFHRIIDSFMIQGGDPDGTGTGGPGYMIKGEFSSNGFKQNDLKHTAGVISMARSKLMDSAGSQFFIMTGASPHLDGAYAAFGKVIDDDSMAAVMKLGKTKTSGPNDRPVEPPKMKTVTVDTFGYGYPEPETIKK